MGKLPKVWPPGLQYPMKARATGNANPKAVIRPRPDRPRRSAQPTSPIDRQAIPIRTQIMLTAKQDTGRWRGVRELRKRPLNPYPRSVSTPPLIVTPLHTDFHPDLFFESGGIAGRKLFEFIRAMITNQCSEHASHDFRTDSRLSRTAIFCAPSLSSPNRKEP
jgi:hypothetical protein